MNKKRIFTKEWRQKLSESHKGIKLSRQHIQNMSRALKGRKLSEEHKKNISKALKKSYEDRRSPTFGKKHSLETKEKISKALKGRKLKNSTKQKLREINLGKECSLETKRKMSEARKGKGIGPSNYGWKGGTRTYYSNLARRTWEKRYKRKIPKNHEIHHIDFNYRNNKISNLKLVSIKEHRLIHLPPDRKIGINKKIGREQVSTDADKRR